MIRGLILIIDLICGINLFKFKVKFLEIHNSEITYTVPYAYLMQNMVSIFQFKPSSNFFKNQTNFKLLVLLYKLDPILKL